MSTFDEIARASPEYVDRLYQRFRQDPASVDERWALLFKGYEFGRESGGARRVRGPGGGGPRPRIPGARAIWPLTWILWREDPDPTRCSALDEFGFHESDLDREMDCRAFRGLANATLRELLAALRSTYCGTLGVEYLSLADKAQREWLQERIEPSGNQPTLTAEDRRRILERLVAAETFEQFLHTKFVGQKRFSLEGAEALIPLLDTVVEDAAAADVDEMVMGMPHRGPPERARAHLEEAVRAHPRRVRGVLPALGRPRRRGREVPPRLFARPRGDERAHHPPVDEREPESPRGHQSRRGGDRPRQAGVPRRWAAQARGAGAHAWRRRLHGPGLGLRDAHAVGAARRSPPAAPCTSSSTTRSASPRTPPTTASGATRPRSRG